ncbi:MAG: MFS transporter [Acidimicrobiales bacterium]|nr:MFS transporter [Acidimicrobiales bacterium]
MSDGESGWRALQTPSRPRPDVDAERKAAAKASPFNRLARVHALSAAGDAMVAVALAGSLFFSIDPSAARWRVGLYLALTVAPFALMSPLIGPALDRAKGGRRIMIVVLNLGRAISAMLMITNIDSLWLFPLAFAQLVFGKGYAISKAAIVPTTVRDEAELVEKNARLQVLSGVAGFIGAAPAGLASLIAGPGAAVFLATGVFAAAFVYSLQLPKTAVADEPDSPVEKAELRGGAIILSASAMGILRGIVGFFSFLVAFGFRGGTDDVDLSGTGTALGAALHQALGFTTNADAGLPAWQLGLVLGGSVVGMLVGSVIAPHARKITAEENILFGALLLCAAVGLLTAWTGGLLGAFVLALTVGATSSAGKLAFDSTVQRDAPDANYGRSFARFETRFQLIWVLGAIIPVVLTIPARLGFFGISCAAGFASISYLVSSRAARGGPVGPLRVEPPVRQPLGTDEPMDPTLVDAWLEDEPQVEERPASRRVVPVAPVAADDPTVVGPGPAATADTTSSWPVAADDPTITGDD